MITRTGSSSKATMEEEEAEEEFGMILHSIKAEGAAAVAAGRLQQQCVVNNFSNKVWRQWRWRLQRWGRWRI